MTRILPALAALNGLLAVSIGAFGAHAIADPQAKAWIATAAQFQLPHAAAVLALLAWRPGWRVAPWLLAVGALLFAGALQVMGLGGPRWLGMVAPVGGTLMVLGWGAVLLGALRSR